MPWIKLTDGWYDDPKIIEAGHDAGWVWLVALSWSARNLTDGVVPARVLRRLVDFDDPDELAARLVDVGLFTRDAASWVVANYHDYQPRREDVLAKRQADLDRKRRGRESSVRKDSERNPSGIQQESAGIPSGVREISARPVPGPVPVPETSSSSAVVAILDAIADARLSAKQATGALRNPTTWRKTVRANLGTDADLLTRVADLTERFDDDPRRIAEVIEGLRPSTGLTKRRLPDGDAACVVADSEAVGA